MVRYNIRRTTIEDMYRDFCVDNYDAVTHKNGHRDLLYRVSIAISRRKEFQIGELPLGSIALNVEQKYVSTLQKNLKYTLQKLEKLCISSQEPLNNLCCQLLACAYFRLPCDSVSKLLDAVECATDNLDGYAIICNTMGAIESSSPSPPKKVIGIPLALLRSQKGKMDRRHRISSPKNSVIKHLKYWTNYDPSSSISSNINQKADGEVKLDDKHDENDKVEVIDIFNNFHQYLKYRISVVPVLHKHDPAVVPNIMTSVEETLELCFQMNMGMFNDFLEEHKFIKLNPSLFYSKVGRQVLIKDTKGISNGVEYADDIENNVNNIEIYSFLLDAIKNPKRDQLILLPLISSILEHANFMSSQPHLFPENPNQFINANINSKKLNHVIPGYFSLIRAYVAVFNKVCCLRSKERLQKYTRQGSLNQILKEKLLLKDCKSGNCDSSSNIKESECSGKFEEEFDDIWLSYWNSVELKYVWSTLPSILQNGVLVNVFIQIIWESTNLYDSNNFDYSLNILKQVFVISCNINGYNTRQSEFQSCCELNSIEQSYTNDADGHLPLSLNLKYTLDVVTNILDECCNFQIILKTLTFLYSIIDLFEANRRKKVVSGIVLNHTIFFKYFLHWNEEVRRLFYHILIHKLFLTNRLDLPCLMTDQILLGKSDFFSPTDVEENDCTSSSTKEESKTYFASLAASLVNNFLPDRSNLSMLNSYSKVDTDMALEMLTNWNDGRSKTYCLALPRKKRQLIFDISLSDDEVSLDLTLAGKLDALLLIMIEQLDNDISKTIFYPKYLEVYAKKALSEYLTVLVSYYDEAFSQPDEVPSPPDLEFNVQTFFSAE